VLLVVLYHAGLPLFGGGFVGVDVFFVLSGFLITSLLLDEHERTGRIDLLAFWARRVRRLLPASTLVLLATAVGGVLVLEAPALRDLGGDLRWAGMFSANWTFVRQGTDYMAQERSESPLLHFWSLGVEEQFYLFWPLLLMGVALLATGRGGAGAGRRRPVLLAVLVGVVLASFAVNVLVTPVNQPLAYFGTPTRAWQLAAGGLLAVVAPVLVGLAGGTRAALAAIGALLLVAGVVLLEEEGGGAGSYPGWPALLPTSATVLLLAAGTGGVSDPVVHALGSPVLQWFGDRSYSLYLWHWPLLVLLPVAVGREGPWITATAVLAALGASVVTLRFVEDPVRRTAMPRRRWLVVGAGLVAVAVAGSFLVGASADRRAAAQIVVTGGSGAPVTLRPSPAVAADDLVSLTDLGCSAGYGETTVGACEFGDPAAERTVVLVGDSHAAVLHSALAAAAEEVGWRLISLAKNGCPAADVTKYDGQRARWFTECDEFRAATTDRIESLSPDLVVVTSAWNPDVSVQDRVTGARLEDEAARAETRAGWVRTLERLRGTGARVAVAHEPPATPFDTSACLLDTTDVAACSFPAPPTGPDMEAAELVPGVEVLDLHAEACGTGTCTPVVGDMVVYRDSNHMTLTYVLSRVPAITGLLESR
jgi:peptidoglycan/LPS O-acetylase OafA/YrhL